MMKAKVNENDINIKNFRSEEKVKELDKDVESILNKFEGEIDKLETKVRSAGYKAPDKSSEADKLVLTVVKGVKGLVKSLRNSLAELRNKMAESGEKAKHDRDENLQADKRMSNTRQGKFSSEKKQETSSKDNIMNSAEIR